MCQGILLPDLVLSFLADDYRLLDIMTPIERDRVRAAVQSVIARTMRSAPTPQDKIGRATALGTFKLLVGVYRACGVLTVREETRLDRIIQDAMARNAVLHEAETEDRG